MEKLKYPCVTFQWLNQQKAEPVIFIHMDKSRYTALSTAPNISDEQIFITGKFHAAALNIPYFSHWLTDTKGRILEVPLRKGKSDSAMIDYLTFIFGIETVYSWFPNEIIGDNQIIEYLSLVVDQIFGFGVLCKLPGKGKFFYDGYYQLGPDNANYGQIHVGGQNDTVLIDLKGVGCMAAKQGWEVSLYHFLKHADCPRITRIDLPILR